MAYKKFRRYRKTYKRRGYRFSRFNLYRKRSSKAQSSQIYSLNKKVNKLKRDLSPDIKRAESTQAYYFDNGAATPVFKMYRLTGDIIASFTNSTNVVRFRGGKVYGHITYADTGEQKLDATHYHSAGIRFIIFRTKAERSLWNIRETDIIDFANSGADYNLNTTRPLKEGIGAFLKIISDRTFNLSNDRDVMDYKFRLPPYTLRRIANTSDVFKGEYGLLVLSAGLKFDIDYTQTVNINQGVSVYFNDDGE